MKRILICTMVLVAAAIVSASPTPAKQPQSPTEVKLQQLELRMQEMIANHGKLMNSLHQMEAMLDAFQNSIHAFRMKLEKK
jgi:hypothetical protein